MMREDDLGFLLPRGLDQPSEDPNLCRPEKSDNGNAADCQLSASSFLPGLTPALTQMRDIDFATLLSAQLSDDNTGCMSKSPSASDLSERSNSGPIRRRRSKIPIPDALKDEAYRSRRQKNNAAAARNREMLRQQQEAERAHLQELEARGRDLNSEILALQQQLIALRRCLTQRGDP